MPVALLMPQMSCNPPPCRSINPYLITASACVNGNAFANAARPAGSA